MASVSDQLDDADQAAMMPETFANPFVKNMIAGAAQAASVPGLMMEPNPYAPGTEEADAYDRFKNDAAMKWSARTAMSMIRPAAGVGAGYGIPQQRPVVSALEQQRNYQPGVLATGQDAAADLKKSWAQTSPIRTVDDLFELAPENQAKLAQVGEDISDQLGIEWKNPGIKGRGRTLEKIDAQGKPPGRINDVVRGGFVVQTPEQADQIAQILGHHFEAADEGWFTTPTGYSDRKIMVRFPNGQVGEVQLWNQSMYDLKNEGHRVYAAARSLKAGDPRKADLESQMMKVYARGLEEAGPEWNAVLGNGGSEGNLAMNSALGRTRASMPAAADSVGTHLPLSSENTQASPGAQISGSPSQTAKVKFIGPSIENMEDFLPSRKTGGRVGYADGGTPLTADADPDFQTWKSQNVAPMSAANDPDFQAWKSKNVPMAASDVVGQAVANAPGSAMQFLKDTARPFMHPIETLSGMGNLGLGALEKGGRGQPVGGFGELDTFGGQPLEERQQAYTQAQAPGAHEKYADAMAGYLADRYGRIENVKKSFAKDPVGVLSDLSMVLSLGGTGAERLPGIMGKTGEVMGNVGRAIDPLMAPVNAAKLGAKGVGEMLTHTGAPSIENAYRTGVQGGDAGEVFRENMRGNAPMTGPVDIARQGLENFRQDRAANYRAGMADIARKDDALGIENQVLDFGKIDDSIQKALKVQTFKGRVIDPGANVVRSEMIDEIEKWKALDPATYHTVEGIDALKRMLGNMMRDTAPNTSARKAAGDIYNAVRGTIVDQAPDYDRVMKGYEQASGLIKDIESSLSLGQRANVDTSLRKLQSIMRNNVNTNYGRRLELGKLLEENGATNLMAALSGQSLNAWAPRGLGKYVGEGAALGSLLHPQIAAALPFMSPRLMGEVAHGVGRTFGRGLARTDEALGRVGLSNRLVGNLAYRLGRATNPLADMPPTPLSVAGAQ